MLFLSAITAWKLAPAPIGMCTAVTVGTAPRTALYSAGSRPTAPITAFSGMVAAIMFHQIASRRWVMAVMRMIGRSRTAP